MANLVPTVPTRVGTASPGAGVAATDKIPAGVLGARGVILEILNGGVAADAMTISDASLTRTGAAAAANAPNVPNGQNRTFKITPEQADANGDVTITHSQIAGVTYKLYQLG